MAQHNPRILVTGGAGYIGSHACKALSQAGYVPVVYDSLCRGHAWAVKYGPLEIGDILDEDRLRDVCRIHRPAGVIHFAALTYVGESVENPMLYYQNNVGGTMALLRAMAAEDINRIVFSSTCAIYGVPETIPIHEDMPQRPINPYGHSKAMVEQMLRDCASAGRLRAVALRYFNAAGADPDGELGEHHDPETHVIPLALQAAKGVGGPLTVFGTDYPTPDGTCIRDYVHVTDLADAHVKALRFTETQHQGSFDAFNLGTGTGVSVKDLLNLTGQVTARPVPVVYGARRPGDPPTLVADPRRANRVLSWSPQHSNPHTILRTAWDWVNRV